MSFVMDNGLRLEILDRLQSDYGFKARGQFLREGRCPSCDKKELYIPAEAPWLARCGRLNKCGAEISIKDLYGDLFEDWSKRYAPSAAEPSATASAYLLNGRGLSSSITAGEYSQESYYSASLGEGSATVRFPLRKGGYWERIIDRPHRFGKKKANFAPGKSYLGEWWQPAATNLAQCDELWITEGVFDALALMHYGKQVVAALSSNHFPTDDLKKLIDERRDNQPTLVWALDGDKAGSSFTKKHVAKARSMGFTSQKVAISNAKNNAGKRYDWNDLHQHGKLSDGREFEEALYNGSLLIAESAAEKARLMYLKRAQNEFWFEFDSKTYWFRFDQPAFSRAMSELEGSDRTKDLDEETLRVIALEQASAAVEIANCYPQALYHQRSEVTDESWYYLRVAFPHSGQPIKMAFTPSQIGSAGDFKKKLLSAAGAWWLGSQHQLDIIMKMQTFNIKSVDTIDFIGYSKQHGAWLLGDLAVKDGMTVEANDEDFFEFQKLRLKSLMKGVMLDIQRDSGDYREDWLNMLWVCFGEQGIVALAFWLGSLFCEQIRGQYKSFPFLEATGEAGAGKTTLLTFLWKLFGREYEGFDPSKSSVAGRSRAMGQVAGMPVVLIEGDRSGVDKSHAKSFDWDELKDFFGGGTLRTRGVRNGGNDTYEPPFRGTICISQNADVSASEAILTRIIKLKFRRPVATSESRAAADNLNGMPVKQLSHFIIKATRLERQILALFDRQAKAHEQMLRGYRDIRIERIVKNHSQIMALVDCLKLVTPITDEQIERTQRVLIGMALDRQVDVNADHPLVHQFWEVYDYIEARAGEGSPTLNHSSDPTLIAINLNDFAENAVYHKQQIAELTLLRELLKTSRRHVFIDSNRPTHSVIRAGGARRSVTVKCWIFKKSH